MVRRLWHVCGPAPPGLLEKLRSVGTTGLASRRARLDELSVDGDGVAGKRSDGRFGFPRLSLRLEVETDPADDAPSVRVARSPRPETVIEHNRREAYRPEA